MSKKVKAVPILSIRLTNSFGGTKIVNSCKGAIKWWSEYKATEWSVKLGSAYKTSDYTARRKKYERRCTPVFRRLFIEFYAATAKNDE